MYPCQICMRHQVLGMVDTWEESALQLREAGGMDRGEPCGILQG